MDLCRDVFDVIGGNMSSRDLLKKQEKEIREGWFKNHEATISPPDEICLLTWGEPKTIHYKIWYILHEAHGTLMVYGDLGEAIYRWHGGVNFQGIASFNLDYFHGKTCASELGRAPENYEWDEKEAKRTIFEHFKYNSDCKGYKKFKDSYLSKTLHNKQEFLHQVHQDIDIFGYDAWEWIYGAGDVIPVRCQAHLIGIKMACEWRYPK